MNLTENRIEIWMGLTKEVHQQACDVSTVGCERIGWTWADGSTYKANKNSLWANTEPNSGELCSSLKYNHWRGVNCSGQKYLCACQKSTCISQ